METKAVLRNLRVSPRKVRLLVDLVRGMKAVDAVNELRFSKKHAAVPVRKLIESAMANAVHNHHMDVNSLVVRTAFVDQGVTLKRWMPRAFGRATMLRKRSSHVTIGLEGHVDHALAKKRAEEAQAAEKKEEKKEVKKAAPKKEATAKKAPAKKATKKKVETETKK